jgi:hypothetical protein
MVEWLKVESLSSSLSTTKKKKKERKQTMGLYQSKKLLQIKG